MPMNAVERPFAVQGQAAGGRGSRASTSLLTWMRMTAADLATRGRDRFVDRELVALVNLAQSFRTPLVVISREILPTSGWSFQIDRIGPLRT